MRCSLLLAALIGLSAVRCDRGAAVPSGSTAPDGGGAGAVVVDCTDAGPTALSASSGTARRVIGSNGTFADTCDSSGNLVKYRCEVTGPCQMQGPCMQTVTGKVLSQLVDCNKTCSGGACVTRCPASGEALVYSSIGSGGRATLESPSSGRSYACTVAPVPVNPAYDCLATPKVGLMVYVTDGGDAGMYCSVPSVRLTVGSTAVDANCAYDCQVPP
jgi:hypothetical protein